MQDSELRVGQWILGCAAVVLFVIALTMSIRNPSLTYDTDVLADDSGRVALTCQASGEGNEGSPYLYASDTDQTFEVTEGDHELDQLRQEAADQAYDHEDPFKLDRMLNTDCAAAETRRLRSTMWVLAGGLGVLALWTAVTAVRAARRGGASGAAKAGDDAEVSPDAAASAP